MALTKQQLRDHLIEKGCNSDDTGNIFILTGYGKRNLRVVLQERVFRIEEDRVGRDGYKRYRRIASGKWKTTNIRNGKIEGMETIF